MTIRLRQLLNMNPEFAAAYEAREDWAVQRAEEVLGLDGVASRRHPERKRQEDGKPHNFCGSCPNPEGCMMCDLDETPTIYKELAVARDRNLY